MYTQRMEAALNQVFAERTEMKPNATDAALERETVITWSDADQVINISTSQRSKVTELKVNPSAKLVEVSGDTHFFELPLGLITIRKGKRAANANGSVRRERPKNVQLCGAPTAAGTPCGSIASKKTGKCPRHS